MNNSEEAYSDKLDKFLPAMLEVQKVLTPIVKEKTADIKMKNGGKYQFSYADLPDFLEFSMPIINERELVALQPVVGHNLQSRIFHTSGQWMQSVFPLGQLSDMRTFGGHITYARRYALGAMIGLSSREDDDTDKTSLAKQVTPKIKDLQTFADQIKNSIPSKKTIDELNRLMDHHDVKDAMAAMKIQSPGIHMEIVGLDIKQRDLINTGQFAPQG
jgi:hypothetical protein